MNVQSYLDQLGIQYRVSHHPIVYTAQDLAALEHVSGKNVIKPVVVKADGRFVLCALPACRKVDMEELKEQLEANDIELVNESELQEIFPDCELGAAPPIGRLYDLPTIMDGSLMSDDHVTFQAGTHSDAITMSLTDYRRAAMPEIAHFGRAN
jgi:Ala-tRNA(Pro) deacylase